MIDFIFILNIYIAIYTIILKYLTVLFLNHLIFLPKYEQHLFLYYSNHLKILNIIQHIYLLKFLCLKFYKIKIVEAFETTIFHDLVLYSIFHYINNLCIYKNNYYLKIVLSRINKLLSLYIIYKYDITYRTKKID